MHAFCLRNSARPSPSFAPARPPRTVLKSLSSVLEMSGSRAVGLVLNGVDTNSIDYFDAYGHHGNGEYFDA